MPLIWSLIYLCLMGVWYYIGKQRGAIDVKITLVKAFSVKLDEFPLSTKDEKVIDYVKKQHEFLSEVLHLAVDFDKQKELAKLDRKDS